MLFPLKFYYYLSLPLLPIFTYLRQSNLQMRNATSFWEDARSQPFKAFRLLAPCLHQVCSPNARLTPTVLLTRILHDCWWWATGPLALESPSLICFFSLSTWLKTPPGRARRRFELRIALKPQVEHTLCSLERFRPLKRLSQGKL